MKPSTYYIITETGPSNGFDAQIVGTLLDDRFQLIPNPFNQGYCIDSQAKFVAEGNEDESLVGVYRDKISVRIQNDEYLFILSEKAHKILEQFCPEIQLFDIDISIGKETIRTHKIVNIPYAVNCINHTDSSLIYWELTHETVYNINELHLDEALVPRDQYIFLLGELRGSVIVVHEKVKKAIEDSRVTGFNFCTPFDFVL